MNFGQAIRQSAFVADLFPRYYNLVSGGVVYGVSYTAAAATVASATATGPFALFNPAASGVQLVLLGATIPVTNSTIAGGLSIGFQLVPGQQPTTTTPGNTPQNMLVGNAGVAKGATFTAGTLVGAPTVPGYFVSGAQLETTTPNLVFFKDDIAGVIVVGPNSGIDIVVTSTGSIPLLTPSLLWAEIPLG